MQLIYRGQTLDYTQPSAPAYRKPYALNWRYQIQGETYGDTPRTVPSYHQPHALNWRYQYNNRPFTAQTHSNSRAVNSLGG